jgi:hypothetical protein
MRWQRQRMSKNIHPLYMSLIIVTQDRPVDFVVMYPKSITQNEFNGMFSPGSNAFARDLISYLHTNIGLTKKLRKAYFDKTNIALPSFCLQITDQTNILTAMSAVDIQENQWVADKQLRFIFKTVHNGVEIAFRVDIDSLPENL